MGGCRRRGFGRPKRCGGPRIGGGLFGRRPGFNIGGIFGRRPVNGCGLNLAGGHATVQPAPTNCGPLILSAPAQPAPAPPAPSTSAPPAPAPSAATIKIQQTIVILEAKIQKFEIQLASLKILLLKLEKFNSTQASLKLIYFQNIVNIVETKVMELQIKITTMKASIALPSAAVSTQVEGTSVDATGGAELVTSGSQDQPAVQPVVCEPAEQPTSVSGQSGQLTVNVEQQAASHQVVVGNVAQAAVSTKVITTNVVQPVVQPVASNQMVINANVVPVQAQVGVITVAPAVTVIPAVTVSPAITVAQIGAITVTQL